MDKYKEKLLSRGEENYKNFVDSPIANDVFNHFKPIIDSSLDKIFANDMKEPYLSFDVEDKQVRCSVHGDGFEVIGSWYYQPFVYIEKEYKNPNTSQQDGLRIVLAERFKKYLKSHPSVFEVLDWDLFFYDETKIKIAFKLTPNKKLRDW